MHGSNRSVSVSFCQAPAIRGLKVGSEMPFRRIEVFFMIGLALIAAPMLAPCNLSAQDAGSIQWRRPLAESLESAARRTRESGEKASAETRPVSSAANSATRVRPSVSQSVIRRKVPTATRAPSGDQARDWIVSGPGGSTVCGLPGNRGTLGSLAENSSGEARVRHSNWLPRPTTRRLPSGARAREKMGW